MVTPEVMSRDISFRTEPRIWQGETNTSLTQIQKNYTKQGNQGEYNPHLSIP